MDAWVLNRAARLAIRGSGEEAHMRQMLLKLWKDEEGPTAVEYALMLVGVSLVIFATVPNLGTAVLGVFNNMVTALTPAAGG